MLTSERIKKSDQHNATNDRIKRRYLHYLRETKGRDNSSLDAVAKAIDRFEEYSRLRDFKKLHPEQVRAFKAHLTAARSERTGEALVGLDNLFNVRRAQGLFLLVGATAGLSLTNQIR